MRRSAPNSSVGKGSEAGKAGGSKNAVGFILRLIAPYRISLFVILIAMILETVMTLAAPWPLKIILDNVVGEQALPDYLTWLRDLSFGEKTMGLALVAAMGVIIITVIGGIAGYIDNYYTESVAQYVAVYQGKENLSYQEPLGKNYLKVLLVQKSISLPFESITILFANSICHLKSIEKQTNSKLYTTL